MLVWPRFDETYYDEIILGIRIGNSCWLLAKQRPIMIYQVVWHWAYSILSSKGGREREPRAKNNFASFQRGRSGLTFKQLIYIWPSFELHQLPSRKDTEKASRQKHFWSLWLVLSSRFVQKFLPGCPCIKTFCDTNTNIIFCDHKGCSFIFLRYKPVFRIPAKTFLGILCRPHLRSFLEPASRKQHIQIKITNNPNSLPLDNWQTRKR